jgi:hypothetical protein
MEIKLGDPYMNKWALILVSFLSLSAFGNIETSSEVSSKIEALAKKLKTQDIRTTVIEVENKKGNPCLPDKYLQINLQVRIESPFTMSERGKFTWETVKSVPVDEDGDAIVYCKE